MISKIPQRTKWDLHSNVKYARTAEKFGFEYALSQIRFMAGYGAENQHEPVSFSQALLHSTEKLKVIAALLPGPWNPAVAAKQIASIDNYVGGRVAVNVVSGWFKAEFTSIGQWWLDHAERYRRSREFIQCLKGIWVRFGRFQSQPYNCLSRPSLSNQTNKPLSRLRIISPSKATFTNSTTTHSSPNRSSSREDRTPRSSKAGTQSTRARTQQLCRTTTS